MMDLTREKLITGNAKAINSLFPSSGFNTALAALNLSHLSGKHLLGESCFFAGRAELGWCGSELIMDWIKKKIKTSPVHH